jgi:hypothetical protein
MLESLPPMVGLLPPMLEPLPPMLEPPPPMEACPPPPPPPCPCARTVVGAAAARIEPAAMSAAAPAVKILFMSNLRNVPAIRSPRGRTAA